MSAPRAYRSPDGAARALAQLLREDAAQRESREPPLDAERERALRAARLAAPRGWRAWHGALALAAALALLAGGALFRRQHGALQFSVDGAARPDGTTVVSTADRGSALRFSDGSEFDVEPASRLRVESSSATGSRLSLLAGKTVAHVVHRERSSWALAAGPFEVEVTGTRFGASWDATRQRLIVELYEGSVQVVGRSLSAPIAVRTGQRLEAGPGAGDWLLSSLSPPEPAPATPGPSAAGHDEAEPASAASAPEAPGPEPKRAARAGFDWSALVQRADFDGIVHEAEAYGLERCLASCAPSDLRILADAARYSGRATLAERSLLALRKRAPAEAATAAFLLARLDEQRGATSEALRWYEQHLQEAPASPYAAEALAGKMRLLQQSAGAAAARATAELYLARFPNGVQAAAARRIVADAARP